MTRSFQVLLLIAYFVLLVPSCDQGIQPPPGNPVPAVSGFSGVISFKNWPPSDSLIGLRLVTFKQFPPTNIITDALSGNAIVYPPIGGPDLAFNVDTVHYFVPLAPGVYQYVVVAQQFGSNVFADWRAVGQYDTDTDLSVPSAITVPADDTLRHIDISVDFLHRPPQPF